ncbi:MAG: hypothetical protein H7Y22_15930 [Gemmatimonadaceae bacterium]|nr:hypothetical protein [Gloeobacterales cyanobacterium ES-bin-141]
MASIGPALLCGLLAALIAGLELVTSKYSRTFPLLNRSLALYIYVLIYVGIGFATMFSLDTLVQAGALKLEGFGLTNPWVQALVLGLSIKAVLHIRLFNVSVGSESFPVGIATIMQLFEPWLLEQISLDEFNAVRTFLAPALSSYQDLDEVKKKIKGNLPRSFSGSQRIAFEVDIRNSTTVDEAMELYLGRFGVVSLNRIFPAIRPGMLKDK